MHVLQHPTVELAALVTRYCDSGDLPTMLDAIAFARAKGMDVEVIRAARKLKPVDWIVERDCKLLLAALSTVTGVTILRQNSATQSDLGLLQSIEARKDELRRGQSVQDPDKLSSSELTVEWFAMGALEDEKSAASNYQPFAVAAYQDGLLRMFPHADATATLISGYMRDHQAQSPASYAARTISGRVSPEMATLFAELCLELSQRLVVRNTPATSESNSSGLLSKRDGWRLIAKLIGALGIGNLSDVGLTYRELLAVNAEQFSVAWLLAWNQGCSESAICHALTAILVEPDAVVRLASVRSLMPGTSIEAAPQLDWMTATKCIASASDPDDDDLDTVDRFEVLGKWIEAAKRLTAGDRLPGLGSDFAWWFFFWRSFQQLDIDLICRELYERSFPGLAVLWMYCGSSSSPLHGILTLQYFNKDNADFWKRDLHPAFIDLAKALIRDGMDELAAAVVSYWLFISAIGFQMNRSAVDPIVPRDEFSSIWRQLAGRPGFRMLVSNSARSLELISTDAAASVGRRVLQSLVDDALPVGTTEPGERSTDRAGAERILRDRVGLQCWIALRPETKGLLIDGMVQWSVCSHQIGGGMLDWAGVMSPFFRAFEVEAIERAKPILKDPAYIAYAKDRSVRGPPTLGTFVHLIDQQNILPTDLGKVVDRYLGHFCRNFRRELRKVLELRNAASHRAGNSLSDFVTLTTLLLNDGLFAALSVESSS